MSQEVMPTMMDKPFGEENKGHEKQEEKAQHFDPFKVFDTVPKLRRMNAVSLAKDGTPYNIFVATFEHVFNEQYPVISRLNRIAVHGGKASLLNLAMADVSALRRTSGGYLSVDSLKSQPGRFFTVGIATYSRLRNNEPVNGRYGRQLCVAVSDLLWPRATAVIAAVYGITDTLNVLTYNHGVTFTSRFLQVDNQSKTIVPGISQSPAKAVGASQKVQPVLPHDADVPVWDGRNAFALGEYRNLPRWDGEIPPGAAVLVIFTVHIYKHKVAEARYDTTSFNIQEVILLELPSPSESNSSKLSLHPPRNIALGVLDDETGPATSNDDGDSGAKDMFLV
ncbi:hypothetical protein OH77DRAFT_1515900 [Trametes cingulata]|nr:hypothetical protein OH77DRAFT_1515900 [Trametes cingulata]